jgi:hypothetical protein
MQVDAIELDKEVTEYLSRIVAEGKALSYVTGYNVERIVGSFTKVTIAFIADEKFSNVDKKEEA